MTVPQGLFSWMPPTAAHFIYTVLLKPPPLRRAAQRIIKGLIPTTIDFRGNRVILNQNDAVLCGSLTLGCYERFVTEVLETLLHPGMTFFDIGANIGIYTALAARLVGSTGRVLAVEPCPANVKLMEQTIALNKFENVTVAVCAVSDKTTRAPLYLCEDNPADNRLCDITGKRAKITVSTTTLDALALENGMLQADVVKIDTQGSEGAVISGMSNLIGRKSVPVIILEFWPWGLTQSGTDPRALLNDLSGAGYSIHEINGDRRSLIARSDIDPLLRMHLERQYVELLLCQDSQLIETLRSALKCRTE